ncbi:hypothetical protein F5Y15DRAFT_429653 [Xylariaceae sp. FL0016]|nr:hypothetical protein F5Y15DRAFT_429653 [Xylariaceae sp. FL0016]
MSSSNSSSSSHSSRTPLHQRSNSEQNRLQIRVVPYSPPRLDGESSAGGSGSGSHAEKFDIHSDDAHHTATSPSTGSSTPRGKEGRPGSALQSFPSWPPLSASPSSTASFSARVKGKGVSGPKLASDSSGAEQSAPLRDPATRQDRPSYGSNIRRINAPTQPSQDDGPASPTWKRSISRRDNFINVHSDKTFSVVLKPIHHPHPNSSTQTSERSAASSLISPPLSNYSTLSSHLSSHERISFDAPIDDRPSRPSSPLSSVPERSVSPSTPGSAALSTGLPEDHIASSPWNYRMVGGLRKVASTPDPKTKGKEKEDVTRPLPPLPETTVTPIASQTLRTPKRKPSSTSDESDSTLEQTTNYKITGRSSPPIPDSDSIYGPPTTSSTPNYRVIGQSTTHSIQSTPPQASKLSPGPSQSLLDTPGSKNFVVHGDTTPGSSIFNFSRRPRRYSSDDSLNQRVREKYSQESLIVQPLKPKRRPTSEFFGLHRQRSSKDSSYHRRGSSFSSISSIISQDSQPNFVRLHDSPSTSSIPQSSWAGAGPPSVVLRKPRMDAHQWSSQLSTVMSEYEGSDRGSRVMSIGTLPDRGSSAFGSRQSRYSGHMRSISSSMLENVEESSLRSRSHSRSDSLDRPSPAYMRGGRELPSPPVRMVRDHDEHGDGLADLEELHQLQGSASRTRLGSFISRKSSDRSLRSSASSRSFNASTIPAWAKVYYGSGERRWLAAASIRSGGDSRPGSSWAPSGSPSHDGFDQNIHNPRRRPMEMRHGYRPESMEITPANIGDIRRGIKKKTSSIWSPHLRIDRRKTGSRYSIWEPPSVTWSAESGFFGKRNIQVALFTIGFIFPFAWMIAAFLPIPPNPTLEMEERGESTTQFRIPEESEPERLTPRVCDVDEKSFQSARWWRNLNRFMSIVGLLILGAVAALVVIGLRMKWAQ